MVKNLSRSVFSVQNIDEIDIGIAQKLLRENKVICFRGLVTSDAVQNALKLLAQNFKKENDNPTIGESPKQIQGNFQKLLVGGKTNSGNYLTRLFRTFYNPLWDEDIYGMHKIFKKMIRIRNRLAGMPDDFALEVIEDNGLWSATRIHQYPTGGGYFQGHKDYVLTDVSNTHDTNFIQVILNMTQQADEFETGGAFIEIDGKKINFEKEFGRGDIVVYDERTFHGVDEIDIHKNLDLDRINGRITAFVSLYQDLNS